jgi:hypothetical protein
MGITIEVCCTPTGDCGTIFNGGECTRTPDAAVGCPTVEIMGFMPTSCCNAMGQCGINSISMGSCLSFEELSSQASGLFDVPPPTACTPVGM